MKPLFLSLSVVLLAACGSLSPQRTDAGSGGGGGTFISSGGGVGTTGGGASSGGGTATGGGSAMGGGTGEPTPLVWSTMALADTTSSLAVVAISGDTNDVYAGQELGDFFHSTGGGFAKLFRFSTGIRGIYASGGTVVMVSSGEIRTCTSNCTTEAAFTTLSLSNSAINWSFFGKAACGEGPNHIVVIVTDRTSAAAGQVIEWDGNTWTRTNSNLGISNPTSCWFDGNGNYYVSGDDKIVFVENGSSTPIDFSTNNSSYRGGTTIDGVTWVVGPNLFVAKGTGLAIAKVDTGHIVSQTLSSVVAATADEVYLLGYYSSTNGLGAGLKWNGTGFTAVGSSLPNFGAQSSVRVTHRTGANEIFVAGSDADGPLIIRGRR
ncbi:MAG: hypothetical protein ACO1OB_01945 [Archangium sp.]